MILLEMKIQQWQGTKTPSVTEWIKYLGRKVLYCFMNTMNSDILLSSHAVFRLLYSIEVGIFRLGGSVFNLASENTVK